MSESVQKSAEDRRGLYLLLARVFGREPDTQFMERFASSGLRAELEQQGFDVALPDGEPAAVLAKVLAVEYTRLFIGPGPHAPLFASVHSNRNEDKGRLWGDSTVEVKAFIETTGLEFVPDYGGVPDHLAIELEFMAHLVQAEQEASQRQAPSTVETLNSIQGRFLKQHLLPWFPNFVKEVTLLDPHPFYASFVAFCLNWLESEASLLGVSGRDGKGDKAINSSV